MSTVVRRFTASPARLSSATWKAISELVCRTDQAAAAEFEKITGVASSLINEKYFGEHPFVLKSTGPRLRVYCLYGEDAISGEDANEKALSWSPTEDEWHAFLPCAEEECEEMAACLKARSVKFSIYDIDKGIPDDETSEATESLSAAATVDWGAFKNL